MTASTDPSTSARGVNYLVLTFALMGGAAVWLLRLVVNSALVNHSCAIGSTWPLWATTGVTTLVAVWALLLSWRLFHTPEDIRAAETARWLGFTAVIFNVTAIVGIVFETVPVAVLDVCRSLG